MEYPIFILMAILLVTQIFLAIRQIKKGAPDGKILLIIDLAVLVIWTPLSIVKVVCHLTAVNIIWYIITLVYMIFTIWYTKALNKSLKH